jgi:ABC-type glycerol-3-phosphate transport system substrate-binding protein
MWVYWFGGKLWDGQRQITANGPEMIQAFHWLQSQSEKYGVDNRRSFGASFGNFQSPQNPFFSDQIAMTLQGVWMYNFIDKYAPQMEWGVAPFPAKDPAKYPLVTIVDADVLAIPKGARHPREAFEFIRYVNQQGPMEKLCLGQRKFSPLVNVSDEFYRRHPNPYIKTFMDLAKSPHAQYAPRLSVWGAYNDEMNVAIDRIMALSATPEQALDTVQSRMQWKLDRMLTRWDAVRDERLKEWSDHDAR